MANFSQTAPLGRNTKSKLVRSNARFGNLALAGQTFYNGCMCGIDATAGTIRRGGGVIATFTGPMLGRIHLPKGLKTIASALATDYVEWEEGVFNWTNVGAITLASKGKLCYADDDQSVSLTATNVIAGIIEDVDSDGVWVKMGDLVRLS